MKRLLIFTETHGRVLRRLATVLLLTMFSLSVHVARPVWGGYVKTSDYFMVSGSVLDSSGASELQAESVHVMVYFKGFECIDAWYKASDPQCQVINGELMFYDQYGDLDADSGDGIYYLRYAFIDSVENLFHKDDHWFTLGYQPVNTAEISSSSAAADSAEKTFLGTLADYSAYHSVGDTNQINIPDSSALVNGVWSVASRTITGDTYTPDVNVTDIDSAVVHSIADSSRQLVWRTDLQSGYPAGPDSSAGMLKAIHSAVDTEIVAIKTNTDKLIFDGNDSLLVKSFSVTTSLPESLWDTLNVIHQDIESLSLTGGGSEPETLIVLDSSDSTQIEGAKITVRTINQSTTKVPGLNTDINGRRILALDADSFWIEITANNYVQTLDTLVVLSGGGSDTLFMTQFNPGSPEDPELCRVYGWVYDISGEKLSGIEITAEIPREYHPVKNNSIVITPFSREDTTDAAGYWYIDLIPSVDLSNDAQYLFTIKYNSGVVYRKQTEVPDFTTWQLQ